METAARTDGRDEPARTLGVFSALAALASGRVAFSRASIPFRGANFMREHGIADLFKAAVRRDLREYLRRVNHCLRQLKEQQIWWRPNAASNSAGNLVLHLCGNMRQWIISGLGGAPDVRDRDAEFTAFTARGGQSKRALLLLLANTFREAEGVLRQITPQALTRRYVIQGFHVTGLGAVAHVYFHFSYHAGQIVYLTKLQQGEDLRLTRLPKQRKRTRPAKR